MKQEDRLPEVHARAGEVPVQAKCPCGRSARREVYDRGMGKASACAVTAFILAGGKSARMGMDKAFVEFDGRTLLARALDLARSVACDVYIVGSQEKFAPFAPVVEDVFRDCGPLGGIHAALRASLTELNVMLAVDAPFVSSAFLQYLISHARSTPEAAVVVPRGDQGWQPLCAIYRREFADAAENALRAGRNRIDRLFDMVRTRVIEEEEWEGAGFSFALFRNLNTPAELEAGMRGA
jgi:molybdopterin-guanine dinucleotide biosynthesis protein A